MAVALGQITPSLEGRKVRTIKMRVKITMPGSSAVLKIADVQLQAGTVATGWTPHVTELPWSQGVTSG